MPWKPSIALDATLGQNSLVQAEEFTRLVDVDGIILTKLDSTARGGIVVAVKQRLGIPVRYIGVGEQLDDFAEFHAAGVRGRAPRLDPINPPFINGLYPLTFPLRYCHIRR